MIQAAHVDTHRRVALKVSHPDTLDSRGRARFLNEARHRNIVEDSDEGTDARRTYLVMEYLDDTTLREWCSALPEASVGTVVRVLLPMGRALAFAHQRGLGYRDGKPEHSAIAREEETAARTPQHAADAHRDERTTKVAVASVAASSILPIEPASASASKLALPTSRHSTAWVIVGVLLVGVALIVALSLH